MLASPLDRNVNVEVAIWEIRPRTACPPREVAANDADQHATFSHAWRDRHNAAAAGASSCQERRQLPRTPAVANSTSVRHQPPNGRQQSPAAANSYRGAPEGSFQRPDGEVEN
jgi:hypothetical protein